MSDPRCVSPEDIRYIRFIKLLAPHICSLHLYVKRSVTHQLEPRVGHQDLVLLILRRQSRTV